MPAGRFPVSLLCALFTACATAAPRPAAPPPDTGFATLVERLSESGGFFPSDNLVSNETSYLHVLGVMSALDATGGVYVGVGPDQNFSYIAAVRPEIAFIIDIRRDNMLHHLLFKSIFQLARSRVEFLCLMTARPLPADPESWRDADIAEIVHYVDGMRPDSTRFEETVAMVRDAALATGIALSAADMVAIRRIHDRFRWDGLDIRYAAVPRYPAWRELILQTDLDGVRRNYLATDESFQYVKELQRRNRVVPVVGDLSGAHALAAIGAETAERGLTIRAFYVSNVEQYLMRGPGFRTFSETVTGLPFDDRSVIIRSYFGRTGSLPQTMPGHYSTQLIERFGDFVRETRAGGYRTYFDLVTRNVLPLKRTPPPARDGSKAGSHAGLLIAG
ncbi:MAG: hypothetical protein L0271_16975 [Gemmatimonadetes bacterium]|nr:hypothetical protein [Gemmatimonadota bacterium]